jgi:hypothetical protein
MGIIKGLIKGIGDNFKMGGELMYYKTAIERKGITSKDNTLYAACKTIQGVSGGIVLEYSKYRNRLVAFWCDYEKRVKAGFGANDYEKSQIWNYFL